MAYHSIECTSSFWCIKEQSKGRRGHRRLRSGYQNQGQHPVLLQETRCSFNLIYLAMGGLERRVGMKGRRFKRGRVTGWMGTRSERRKGEFFPSLFLSVLFEEGEGGL